MKLAWLLLLLNYFIKGEGLNKKAYLWCSVPISSKEVPNVLKSLCGPLAGYAELASHSSLLCEVRPFFGKREPGLSNISEIGGKKKD